MVTEIPGLPDESFRGRKNHELILLLTEDGDFLNELEALRGRFDIPDGLDPEEDIFIRPIEVYGELVDLTFSHYLEDNNLTKEVEKELSELGDKYKMPINFEDWLQWLFLYRENPPWVVHQNYDVLADLVYRPSDAVRTGISTQEKNYIKRCFREHFGIKIGRPPQYLQQAYKELMDLLDENKNTERKNPSVEKLKEALEAKKQRITEEFTEYGAEKIDKATSWKDVVAKVYENDLETGDEKLSQRLRRMKNRHDSKKKKPKN